MCSQCTFFNLKISEKKEISTVFSKKEEGRNLFKKAFLPILSWPLYSRCNQKITVISTYEN